MIFHLTLDRDNIREQSLNIDVKQNCKVFTDEMHFSEISFLCILIFKKKIIIRINFPIIFIIKTKKESEKVSLK